MGLSGSQFCWVHKLHPVSSRHSHLWLKQSRASSPLECLVWFISVNSDFYMDLKMSVKFSALIISAILYQIWMKSEVDFGSPYLVDIYVWARFLTYRYSQRPSVHELMDSREQLFSSQNRPHLKSSLVSTECTDYTSISSNEHVRMAPV